MPDFDLFELLGFGGTGFATTLAVLGLFWKADDAFSDEFRELVAKRLQRMTIDTYEGDWPESFANMFDRLFGKEHLSLRCAVRSCVASVLAVIILTAISAFVDPIHIQRITSPSLTDIVIIFGGTVIFNLLPDYFSLLETRYSIKLIIRCRSNVTRSVILVADLIATVIIFFIFGSVLFLFLIHLMTYVNNTEPDYAISFTGLYETFQFLIRLLTEDGFYLRRTADDPLSIGVFFYSTLFTSVWLWFLITGWFAVRNTARFTKVLEALKFALPITTKPMRAIGEVSALATALAFILLGAFGVDFGSTSVATPDFANPGAPQ